MTAAKDTAVDQKFIPSRLANKMCNGGGEDLGRDKTDESLITEVLLYRPEEVREKQKNLTILLRLRR